MILDDYHPEIKNYVISKCLRPGDQVDIGPGKGKFKGFSTIYHGRLGAPEVEPGKYVDRNTAEIEINGETQLCSVDIIKLDENTLLKRVSELEPGWHLISLAKDKLEELPETEIIESDIVRLIDRQHPNYSENQDRNQYTVNRINYGEKITYKLRAGSNIFEVTDSQIVKCADGPIRLFYGGEAYKLMWKSIKDEAEFFVLLGRYLRIYNPINKSYYWDLGQARQMISLGKGQAVLAQNEGYALINFWDPIIGQEITYYADLILDI